MLIWREVCLTNSLTSGDVFNSNLLKVNKIQQSFNLGCHATVYAVGFMLFTEVREILMCRDIDNVRSQLNFRKFLSDY